MGSNPSYILQAVNISKCFPGVQALDSVQLSIEKGKVHALMGENGAGKSTLMKILMGMYRPDSGEIYFKGEKITFANVHDAIKKGFSMIHQELFPFPELTVAENIFMGTEPTSYFPGWINRKKMNKDAASLLHRIGAMIPANRIMKDCSIAEMQLVEIAKAISNNAEIIIMDEPTSALSGREVNILFKIIKELKQEGISIIYISHKMDEVFSITDSITVMRDGKFIITGETSSFTQGQLIALIVGREILTVFDKKASDPGETLLAVSGLTGAKFHDINFEVRRGEILGIAGLMGAGRTEIVNAVFGLEKIYKGQLKIKGVKIRVRSPGDAIKAGIGLVSEDRKHFGLVLSASVQHNVTLSALNQCSSGPFLDVKKEKRIVDAQIIKMGIKTPSKNQPVNFLSGGNQQKVVLSKVLLNDPDIIILDEPTRGIDIGAKAEIYKLIFRLAEAGKAIILISSELPEIMGMSDRILVLHEGCIKAELSRNEATPELIMQYAMS